MAKIILLVLGVLLAYWILRVYRRRVERKDGQARGAGAEDMVRCLRCGVHLPRSESIAVEGQFYCSPEHERAHQSERRSG